MNHKLISFLLLVLGYTNLCIAQQTELPYIKHKDGRHCLMVEGKPFLMLGAQCNNSSAWPDTLPEVWSAMEQLKVNTLEIPIYWEQFEPQKGQFDYSVIDTIITQAREHNVRVVLLWFATWKNGSNHYMPGWMKQQPEKYPNMINKEGQEIDSPSPHAEATLNEDVRAFSAFMKHLKEFDKQHTVIMVQVQNEPGAWGSVRDYSKDAQKIFDKPVPKEVLKAVGKNPKSNKNWKDVFGNDADEFFQVWHVANYIGKIAQAGKHVYPLPLYVNAAIRNPINPGPPYYQVGGPNDNVFELWKTAAPAVDVLAPDIYFSDTETYLKAMEIYARGDNPLFVPETFWHDDFPKFFYSALGYGAIGYAPFGLDDTRIRINKKGEVMTAEEMYEPTTINFELFTPMASEIARLNFDGKIQTAVQLVPVDPTADRGNAVDRVNYITDKTLHLKSWDADVAFGTFSRLSRSEFQPQHPDGRFLIAELSENQFLVCGYHCRVMFKPSGKNKNSNWQYLTVEEGHYENGVFKVERILNGDQTDWGLNFDRPKVLRVTLYTR
ncbi:DUF5597 domain-containing protein [Flavobacterium rakeshii]|uniref:DUF5597 domain-containing protein n=1 Tax=Flavobacterium rakeshii TaxID=1038845 RepID=UPI002E7B12FC|nr:DUF5597 domain-containing protein [Flavobacterium rakeshii]MEE1898702.1 DUF5597 domain-containing protein [Flavobacterium rakeshii]